MGYYIKKKDQEHMIELCEEYLRLTEEGTKHSPKAELVMNEFFSKYADRIIRGIIHSPQYRYFQFAEIDDLENEARMHIYNAVVKRQWKPEKGASFFSFLSTVVSRNLLTFTLKMNRHRDKKSDQELETIFNEPNMEVNYDFDQIFLMEDAFSEIRSFFTGRDKMLKLTDLLERYYVVKISQGEKFVKKHFIEHAKAQSFSPSLTNTFFSHISTLGKVKGVAKELLG